ncbi:hypothetical protein V6N13_058078 [Hibiscus sabdariffa]|uniref:Uncharacterized protein n=1 Tax=Hibiscus sabdariffa TaxID=183260 RepID=A0ABR2GH98_9ROSI
MAVSKSLIGRLVIGYNVLLTVILHRIPVCLRVSGNLRSGNGFDQMRSNGTPMDDLSNAESTREYGGRGPPPRHMFTAFNSSTVCRTDLFDLKKERKRGVAA